MGQLGCIWFVMWILTQDHTSCKCIWSEAWHEYTIVTKFQQHALGKKHQIFTTLFEQFLSICLRQIHCCTVTSVNTWPAEARQSTGHQWSLICRTNILGFQWPTTAWFFRKLSLSNVRQLELTGTMVHICIAKSSFQPVWLATRLAGRQWLLSYRKIEG